MNWDQIEGWFSPGDASFVRQICGNIKDGIVVELGFFAGRSTAVMAPICINNNTTYHAVDNCKGSCRRDPATKAQISRDMLKIFNDNMTKVQIRPYINVHIIDSSTAAGLFSDKSVDFCFVDASHMAEDVKRDIEAWWPKIKQGGVLGGHDYSWGSVCGVTNNFAQDNGLNLVAHGNCWKIIKEILE